MKRTSAENIDCDTGEPGSHLHDLCRFGRRRDLRFPELGHLLSFGEHCGKNKNVTETHPCCPLLEDWKERLELDSVESRCYDLPLTLMVGAWVFPTRQTNCHSLNILELPLTFCPGKTRTNNNAIHLLGICPSREIVARFLEYMLKSLVLWVLRLRENTRSTTWKIVDLWVCSHDCFSLKIDMRYLRVKMSEKICVYPQTFLDTPSRSILL